MDRLSYVRDAHTNVGAGECRTALAAVQGAGTIDLDLDEDMVNTVATDGMRINGNALQVILRHVEAACGGRVKIPLV